MGFELELRREAGRENFGKIVGALVPAGFVVDDRTFSAFPVRRSGVHDIEIRDQDRSVRLELDVQGVTLIPRRFRAFDRDLLDEELKKLRGEYDHPSPLITELMAAALVPFVEELESFLEAAEIAPIDRYYPTHEPATDTKVDTLNIALRERDLLRQRFPNLKIHEVVERPHDNRIPAGWMYAYAVSAGPVGFGVSVYRVSPMGKPAFVHYTKSRYSPPYLDGTESVEEAFRDHLRCHEKELKARVEQLSALQCSATL